MKNKSLWERIEFAVSAKFFAPIILIIGVSFYILVQYILNTQLEMGNEFKMFLEVVKLLAGTLISTGLISLFLNISSVKQSMENTIIRTYREFMGNILKANFDLDGYDKEVLEKLKSRIVLHNSKNSVLDATMLENSIYSLEKMLVNFTKGLYIEYHERTTIITPDEGKQVFKKKVMTKYKVVNLFELPNKVEFEFSLMEGTDTSKENFYFSNFIINSTDLSKEIDKCVSVETSSEANYNTYKYKVMFCRPLSKCKEHIVKITFEYEVPMFDLTHTYRVSTPCKKLNHNIILDGKEASDWEIIVSGFAPGINDNIEEGKNYIVSLLTSSNAQVNFNDWILPGEGYVIILKKIDKKNEII